MLQFMQTEYADFYALHVGSSMSIFKVDSNLIIWKPFSTNLPGGKIFEIENEREKRCQAGKL